MSHGEPAGCHDVLDQHEPHSHDLRHDLSVDPRLDPTPAGDGSRSGPSASAGPRPLAPRLKVDLAAVAEEYIAARFPDRQPADLTLVLDEDFCVDVADHFEVADGARDEAALRSYDALKAETLDQFDALVGCGVTVRPWLEPGQPYRSSAELHEQVPATSVLHVFLTRCGHGPCAEVDETHPMCEPSPVVLDGEPLLHNDLFRAVHDAFGHVMNRHDFGPAGEFHATHEHLRMYSAEAGRAVFAETIGQICWFYYGPHLRGPDGKVRRRGQPGYLPPAQRPYPRQKVFLLPDELLARYESLFERIGA